MYNFWNYLHSLLLARESFKTISEAKVRPFHVKFSVLRKIYHFMSKRMINALYGKLSPFCLKFFQWSDSIQCLNTTFFPINYYELALKLYHTKK